MNEDTKSKKNCMFQFATTHEIIENTELITLVNAKALWEKNKTKFMKLHGEDSNPEMCIWIDCKDDGDYHSNIWYVDCESIIKGNKVYTLQLQGAEGKVQ